MILQRTTNTRSICMYLFPVSLPRLISCVLQRRKRVDAIRQAPFRVQGLCPLSVSRPLSTPVRLSWLSSPFSTSRTSSSFPHPIASLTLPSRSLAMYAPSPRQSAAFNQEPQPQYDGRQPSGGYPREFSEQPPGPPQQPYPQQQSYPQQQPYPQQPYTQQPYASSRPLRSQSRLPPPATGPTPI